MVGRLSRATLEAPVKPLALPSQVPAGVYSSLDDGGKAVPLRQYPSSRRSSCGSLQSQPAPLAGAGPKGLMPPKN